MRSFITIAALTTACLAYAETAAACSANGCRVGELLPTDGKVPANALSWLWQPAKGFPQEGEEGAVKPEVRVFVEGETEVELALEQAELAIGQYRLTPAELPEVGSILRVEHTNPCATGEQNQVSHIEVTAATTPPKTLGTLQSKLHSGNLDILDGTEECSSRLNARYADVELELSPAAKAFESVLRYSLLVDGEEYHSDEAVNDASPEDGHTLAGGRLGAGHERAYALCENFDDGIFKHALSEGPHTLQMAGELLDGTRILSEEIAVDLRCDSGTPGSATEPSSASSKNATDDDGCAQAAPSLDAGSRNASFGLLAFAVALTLRRRRSL